MGPPRGCAVVNGAGPCGLIAAACLAFKGFRVQVYEQGSLNQAQSNDRSFGFSLNLRTFDAMKAFGMTTEVLEQHEFKELCIFPVKGRPVNKIPLPTHQTLVERHQMVKHLLAELDRLYKQQVTIHRHHKLLTVDLCERKLTYVNASSQAVVSYDLLVAADGVHSLIREAMLQQVPGFQVQSDGSYEARCKVVLPQSFNQTPADAKATLNLHEINDPKSKQSTIQHSGAIWVLQIPGHGPTEAALFLHRHGLPQYRTKEDFARLLGQCQLPDDVIAAMAQQAADPKRWCCPVNRLRCSQLHGPKVVILGEAAHTVTPHDGQGCNAGAEDVAVLADVLDQETDLDCVPAAFTRARLADANALFQLNRMSLVRAGFMGPWHWAFFWQLNMALVWGALHRFLPFLVGPPPSDGAFGSDGKPVPYSGILAVGNQRAYTTLLAAAVVAAGIVSSVVHLLPITSGA